MNTKKNFYSVMTLVVFALLFWASTSVKKVSTTEKTYSDTKKEDENITVSYKLPVIKPTGKTTQTQIKGSTTISISIVPFEASRSVKQNRTVGYADPTKPGYDIYEVTNIPYYAVSPEAIRFKMRISNSNEDVPLELSKITFALFIDGTVWDFPEKYEKTWEKGLVSSVSPKEYIIDGPQLAGLYSAKEIMLNLSGVPTDYDKGGYVTQKEKFVWYFQSQMEDVQKDEKKTYTYETTLIEKKACAKCSGTGTDPQRYKCSTCDGKGAYVNVYDKKTYKCSKCDGSGIVYIKCGNCGGGGVLSYPKSEEAPLKSSVTWTGWSVNVKTNPPGAKVSMVDTKTGEYKSVGMSNLQSYWYSSNAKSYPIIIEYQGKSVKVLPYNPTGKEMSEIVVDFLSGAPIVKKGTKVN